MGWGGARGSGRERPARECELRVLRDRGKGAYRSLARSLARSERLVREAELGVLVGPGCPSSGVGGGRLGVSWRREEVTAASAKTRASSTTAG